MKTVHKYSYKYPTGIVQMPKGAIIRKAGTGMQNGQVQLWAEVETDNPLEDRRFIVCGTGWEIEEENACYIDTVLDGIFVWHVYEVV